MTDPVESRFELQLRMLEKGAEVEDALSYGEPPQWLQPIRHTLGAVYLVSERYGDAERVYRADLVTWPDNGWSLFGLSRALRGQDKVEEAETYLREALKGYRRTRGDDHFRTHSAMHDLSELLRETGDYVQSERLGREAIRKDRHIWPDQRPQGRARFLVGHARTLIALGRFDEAEIERLLKPAKAKAAGSDGAPR